jgi:hypothetical protein
MEEISIKNPGISIENSRLNLPAATVEKKRAMVVLTLDVLNQDSTHR